MWRFNKRIVITTLIIGDIKTNRGQIILCVEWNDLRIWNRLVPLSNELFLAVLLLAKCLRLFLLSMTIEPIVSQWWRAVD